MGLASLSVVIHSFYQMTRQVELVWVLRGFKLKVNLKNPFTFSLEQILISIPHREEKKYSLDFEYRKEFGPANLAKKF